jgi:hypothetical protein
MGKGKGGNTTEQRKTNKISSTIEGKKDPHRSSATYHKGISGDLRKPWEYQFRIQTPFLSWHGGYLSKS